MLRQIPAFPSFLCQLVFAGMLFALPASVTLGWEPKVPAVAAGEKPLFLNSEALIESSGLAFSIVDPGCVWSHNDSGDRPRLLGFNHTGKATGRIDLKGVKAIDWEDMASFKDGVPRLLVADVGDNDCNRDSVSLFIFDEPNPRRRTTVNVYEHVVVRYPNGPENCEAVAVDVKGRRVLLLAKSPLIATMYQVDLPKRMVGDPSSRRVSKTEVVAKPVRKLAIPLATGMDLCPKTGDLWVSNYLQAFCYPFARRSTLESRLQQVPRMLDLPRLKQVEAVAVDKKGRVWVTSEGKPAPLQRVMVEQ